MKKLFSLLTATVLFLAASMVAQAQVTPGNPYTLTNLPAVITSGASSNLDTTIIPVIPNAGMSFAFRTGGTNASSTAALTLYGNLSLDGSLTNWTTSNPIVITVPGNGAATNGYYTNFSATVLGNSPWVKLTSVTNNNASYSVPILGGWAHIPYGPGYVTGY